MSMGIVSHDNSERPPLNLESVLLQIAKIQAYLKAQREKKETGNG